MRSYRERIIDDNDASKPECEWDASAEESFSIVYLDVFGTGSADAAESEYNLLDDGSEPVNGLGGKAHWVSQIETLEVLQGAYTVEVQVVDFKTGADAKSESEDLAAKVLDRLP